MKGLYEVTAVCGVKIVKRIVKAHDESDAIDKVQMELFYGGRIVKCKWLRWCD